MATMDELIKEMRDLLVLSGKSLEEMQKEAGHTSSGAMQPVSITIEWLNERIGELEASSVALRSVRAREEDAKALP